MASRPYKTICISMYVDDLTELDECVRELKSRGISKANRSGFIRHAIKQVDLAKVTKGDVS